LHVVATLLKWTAILHYHKHSAKTLLTWIKTWREHTSAWWNRFIGFGLQFCIAMSVTTKDTKLAVGVDSHK